MPWRGRNATICKGCGRHVSECGRLSARYKCADCAVGRMVANIEQMAARSGPAFDLWRVRMAACVGAILPQPPDDRPS